MNPHKKRQPIPEPVKPEIRESTYQPSKADHAEEHDMPGMNDSPAMGDQDSFVRPRCHS